MTYEVQGPHNRIKNEIIYDKSCAACNGEDHFWYDCSYLHKIPTGAVIGDIFDEVCIGCGRIGEICCKKGAYATLRECGACWASGHWYWDCPTYPLDLEADVNDSYLRFRVMIDDEGFCSDDEGCDLYPIKEDDNPPKKLKVPDMEHDTEEVKRLKNRSCHAKPEMYDHGCPICAEADHYWDECPCLDEIPPGVVIGSAVDEVCIGCGKIGEICGDKGAYAVVRECGACRRKGHRYWDCPIYPVQLQDEVVKDNKNQIDKGECDVGDDSEDEFYSACEEHDSDDDELNKS